MAGKVAPIDCPECGSKMWDNSETKKGKQPDYACKDKQNCGKGVWLKDSEKAALSAVAPGKRPPIVLDKMMKACLSSAVECAKVLPEGAVADHDIILRIAQSLYIARTDGKGILEVEKKALADLQAKQEAERKAAEEARREAAEREAASQAGRPPSDSYFDHPDSSDLPF